jgi:hypothetical protein
MPRLACPHCKQVLSVPEEQRGKVITCSSCNRPIRVPAGPAQPVTGQAGAAAPINLPPAAPAAEPKSSRDAPGPLQPERATQAEEEENHPPEPAPTGKGGGGITVAGVLSGLGGLVFVIGLILILSGKWVPLIANPVQKLLENLGIPPVVAIAATGLILLIPVGLVLASFTKSSVLGALPEEVDFRTVRVEDYPNLDREKLAESTAAMTRLGFHQVADYTAVTDSQSGVTGFGRLFYHDNKNCFGEINQAFKTSGDATLLRVNFFTLFADGWSLGSGNRRPTKVNYLLRRPKALWKSYPDEEPEAIFQSHVELGDRLAKALKVEPLRDGSPAAYFKHEKAATVERKALVRRRSAVRIALELWLFDKYPKLEWLGAFAKKARA